MEVKFALHDVYDPAVPVPARLSRILDLSDAEIVDGTIHQELKQQIDSCSDSAASSPMSQQLSLSPSPSPSPLRSKVAHDGGVLGVNQMPNAQMLNAHMLNAHMLNAQMLMGALNANCRMRKMQNADIDVGRDVETPRLRRRLSTTVDTIVQRRSADILERSKHMCRRCRSAKVLIRHPKRTYPKTKLYSCSTFACR